VKSDYPSIVPQIWPEMTNPPYAHDLHDDLVELDFTISDATDDESFTTSNYPSQEPSDVPSYMPSDFPSSVPSDFPSNVPSDFPSNVPSDLPSMVPSDFPSYVPSGQPSYYPSEVPSSDPSSDPSFIPSSDPSPSVRFSTFGGEVFAYPSVAVSTLPVATSDGKSGKDRKRKLSYAGWNCGKIGKKKLKSKNMKNKLKANGKLMHQKVPKMLWTKE
jgi:hypothetical protein